MNKIVGFTISKCEIDHLFVDPFNVGFNILQFQKNGFYVYLWGIGDLEACKIEGMYSLSFPQNSSLLDRNVLLCFEKEKILIKNDWLASIPVFYNEKELIISTLSLVTLKNEKIDEEGLQYFFEFGYSVFERTIFEGIRFMRFSSTIILEENALKIEYSPDPIKSLKKNEKDSDENEVWTLIKKKLKEVEEISEGQIVIPTSGGYDSRILNLLVGDKSRISSYTYGGSKQQENSKEVVYAHKLSELLKTKWKHIKLNNFYKEFNSWFNLFGFSTHLHGMYHVEFFKKIKESDNIKTGSLLLSGIYGDLWAGKISNIKMNSHLDLKTLGFSHGINLNERYSKIRKSNQAKKHFYSENKELLKDPITQSIFLCRFKIILLSYLTQLPEYYGFIAWTPFLDLEIVSKMLSLPTSRKANRIWQAEFFRKNNIELETMGLKGTSSNTLDVDNLKTTKFELLSLNILRKYVSEKRIKMINSRLKHENLFNRLNHWFLTTPKVKGVCQKLGFKHYTRHVIFDYYILKVLEKSIKYELDQKKV